MNDNLLPSQCRPLNAYGLSKNMFDQHLEQHNLLDKVVGLKYFNVPPVEV
jgi:UDP-glucose 4-epimerase